ncbi:MAG: ankyrin repeat domain-containing protein [Spirochaetes bacterium]|nr:ankyrin repeat domain-containing protein [Spirochaetota bacterium]
MKGEYQRVLLLINQGVDVNYKKQFLSHDEYPLNGAIKSSSLEIVKLLIINGARIDTENENRHCLSDAIYNGNIKIILYLISQGVYVNRSCDSQLLFTAVYSRLFNIIRFVIEDLDVCIDSVDFDYGDTPIFKTISGELFQETSYLLQKGASVNIQNKEKQTPLHRAVFVGNIRIIELLLKNGADITIKDEKGMTPLDYAEKAKKVRVVQLLKRYTR